MSSRYSRVSHLISAAALTVLGAAAARADDTEIFIGQPTSAAAPNIMFILDTSGSMGTQVQTVADYDPNHNYLAQATGSCAGISDRVYYTTGSTPPGCSSDNYFPKSRFLCAKANESFSAGGIFLDYLLRWSKSSGKKGKYSWRSDLSDDTATDVECQADAGVDGALTAVNPYPLAGNFDASTTMWTATASSSAWLVTNGILTRTFSPNYIVYYNQFRTSTLGTRMSIMKSAATSLLNSLSGVNVGLMRYDTNASGGMVAYPVSPIETARSSIISALNAYSANGNTPLSETLYEAYLYFSGGDVVYGDTSSPFHSVDASRTPSGGANYNSPADYSCQKNAIVYLTDGLPTADYEADNAIKGLTDFATLAAPGCMTTYPNGSGNGGQCLGAMAQYMANEDGGTDLRPNSQVPGQQTVKSYFIGFGDDFASSGQLTAAFDYLDDAATRGGGKAFQAGDLGDLTTVLTGIVREILDESTMFAAPTVAVNAFNRTQTLSDLYVSVFQPNSDTHWAGNVKKYTVTDGVIKDSSTPTPQDAVNETTGFFKDTAKSFWSASADGKTVTKGGAANKIPDPDQRNVYTYIGANPSSGVTLSSNVSYSVATGNSAITATLLGIDGTSDPVRDKLINWARGMDVNDETGPSGQSDGSKTDARHVMGDPIHAQPAVIIYGGTEANPDAVIFAPTNDGYLHAFDATTGVELWAFIPQELLPDLVNLYANGPSPNKHYSLDGDVRVLKYDINGDGIVDSGAGDRVIIFFGQGRGGSNYYALDVTAKSAPKFLWSAGPSILPGIGQAWSTPVIARMNISGESQNSQKLVLVMGGGYDQIEETTAYSTSNTVGNALYVVDALKGTLLWSAGQTGADRNLSRMDHSIPSNVTVMDLDGDTYADRMYVGDMAGQLWRFDVTNGNDAANLVTGGVIASLGSHDESTHTAANTRRFYYAPDVSAVSARNTAPFLNIAIGSGYRGHPLDTTAQDRFYAIRDYRPFSKMTQADYDALVSNNTIVRDADLIDVTLDVNAAVPSGASGWKLLLNQPSSWIGEKVLAASNTFQNTIFFTTYSPSASSASNPCSPGIGSNRAYAVSLLSGAPIPRNRDSEGGEEGGDDDGSGGTGGDGELTPADRYTQLKQTGIAPEIAFLFPENNTVVCLSGAEVLGACTDFQSRVKTYWRESGAN